MITMIKAFPALSDQMLENLQQAGEIYAQQFDILDATTFHVRKLTVFDLKANLPLRSSCMDVYPEGSRTSLIVYLDGAGDRLTFYEVEALKCIGEVFRFGTQTIYKMHAVAQRVAYENCIHYDVFLLGENIRDYVASAERLGASMCK